MKRADKKKKIAQATGKGVEPNKETDDVLMKTRKSAQEVENLLIRIEYGVLA